jgi:hypothetical protein
MSGKLKIYLRSLSKGITPLIFISSSIALAINGYIPIDNTRIKLSNGTEVLTVRVSPTSHKVVLKRKQKVLWERTFEEEYDRLWEYAFFVPIKKNHFSYDLNHDGKLKIAIATWDGGNAMDHRTALIFTVTNNSLEYYGAHKFNLEYGRYVYP